MSTLDKFDSNTIIRNKNYENDLKYDLELNRILLKIIGVWPADSRHLTNFDRIIAVLVKFLTILLLLFYIIPIGCHLLFVEKNWSVKIQLLVAVTYSFEAMVKYGIAIALNEKIRCCIDMIDSDWREVDWTVYRSIMLENARSCRVFTTLLVTVTYTGMIMYHFIVPFMSDKSRLRQNSTKLTPVIYETEFFIVDSRVSPMCEIVYLGQSLSAAATCWIHCGICTIIVKFAMHACTRYQMVIALMQNIDDVEINDCNGLKCQNEERRTFDHVVRRHLSATEFVPQIENALNGMCFACLMTSTVNICFIGYTVIMEWEKSASGNTVSFVFGAMSFVSNIFVLCYCGELLGDQCRRVSTAGYMTNWWNMRPHESRALILIIAVAQLPVEFTAGKLFNLSLTTFCTVNPLDAILNYVFRVVKNTAVGNKNYTEFRFKTTVRRAKRKLSFPRKSTDAGKDKFFFLEGPRPQNCMKYSFCYQLGTGQVMKVAITYLNVLRTMIQFHE